MKIAVVGSKGFIGSSLIQFLSNKNFLLLTFNTENPLMIQGELKSEILDADVIVWCASRVNPLIAELREDLIEQEILEWKTFLNFLDGRFKSGKKLVYLSSGGCTYSSGVLPFSENSEARGVNRYGKLKIAMENELRSRDISSIILRVANVYGPGQPRGRGQGVIAEWKYAIEANLDIEVFGSPESFRDYIFIDDLCEGIVKAFSIKSTHGVFNLGSGIATELKSLLTFVGTLKSDSSKIIIHEKRATDREGYFLDVSKFAHQASWTPTISIDVGLRKTIVRKSDLKFDK